jgi:hypothetical protein
LNPVNKTKSVAFTEGGRTHAIALHGAIFKMFKKA